MPTGRGFEWTRTGIIFKRKLICSTNCSFESLQWLDFMGNDPRFIDKNGKRQVIRSGWNTEEVKIGTYPVDGYVKVDEITYALQYDGCYYVSY